MSWYDPSSWGSGDDANQVKDAARNQLNRQAANASGFAGQAEQNYLDAGRGLNSTYGQLGQTYGQLGQTQGSLSDAMKYQQGLMTGQNSVSAMQLRQGLQQNLAAQQSMAAGAAPQNSAMAARMAARNSASLGYGLSGQAAMAGLQERNQAAQNYGQLGSQLGQLQMGQGQLQLGQGQLQLGARGQDANVALGSRQNAIGGYGTMLNGQQDQGWLQRNMNFLKGLGGATGTV